ncbi:hypothetical protein NQZ68_020262 [Dissostichus eleginoides]|nr:hypothetical protein NQZ68_020262 [Dissostichus eleginoides]
MQRYGSGRSVFTSTTTTEDPEDFSSERRIRRLRLTLVAADDGNKEPTTANSETTEKEKDVRVAWKKKNGLTQRGRPAGRESPPQQLGDMTNGAPETALQNHGPKVYGVVQRTGSDRQQEVMAREWSVNHLQREMEYIREVRDSLEKVREKMYGQFGGMQQSMQSLTQEIRTANSHRRSLESEVRVRTEAMDSFDQMNSSLITANIGLQKSLIENCQRRMDTRDDVKSLRSASEKTQEKLREKEKELEAAQVENKTLRLQVESAQEANNQALQELSAKLQQEYEEKLQNEQRNHREEIENLQAQLDEYIRRLEEAETNIRIAEAKIADRDQRIIELERLLECMGREKSQFHKKLEECEQRLRLMELTDKTDATVAKKSKELQSESVALRERIKHLNDMVFCQQRKVKGMIEEVGSLRAKVAQKDMFISELLDRIAIVECEVISHSLMSDCASADVKQKGMMLNLLFTMKQLIYIPFNNHHLFNLSSSNETSIIHSTCVSQTPSTPDSTFTPHFTSNFDTNILLDTIFTLHATFISYIPHSNSIPLPISNNPTQDVQF